MALFFFLGDRQKPRQFSYKPRSYDPEAEAREERRKIVLGENYNPDGGYVPGAMIRENRYKRLQQQERESRKKSTVIRGVIALILVTVMAFMIVHYLGIALSN